jgi:hypothetical protein
MSGSPKRETISPKWQDFHGLFARPSQSWSGDRTRDVRGERRDHPSPLRAGGRGVSRRRRPRLPRRVLRRSGSPRGGLRRTALCRRRLARPRRPDRPPGNSGARYVPRAASTGRGRKNRSQPGSGMIANRVTANGDPARRSLSLGRSAAGRGRPAPGRPPFARRGDPSNRLSNHDIYLSHKGSGSGSARSSSSAWHSRR